MRESRLKLIEAFEHLSKAGQIRSDICAILSYPEDGPKEIGDSLRVFWDLFDPKNLGGNQLAPLAPPDENVLLEELAAMVDALQPTYKPDQDRPQSLPQYVGYLHIASARALLLKKVRGFNDDTRQVLAEISREMARSGFNPRLVPLLDPQLISLLAVTSWVLDQLSRMQEIDARFTDALIKTEEAADSLCLFFGEITCDRQDSDEAAWGGRGSPSLLAMLESSSREMWLDSERAAAVCEKALGNESGQTSNDWVSIADACSSLSQQTEAFDLPEELVLDNGELWSEFWLMGRGRALERLRPDKLAAYLKQNEDKQAAARLQKYFFSDEVWKGLTEKARESLIQADSAFFSGTAGSFNVTVSQLKIAVEEILYPLFWQPLTVDRGQPDLSEVAEIVKKVGQERRTPSLPDYCQVFEHRDLRACRALWGIDSQEWDSFLKDLPKTLKQLNKLRTAAEHHRGVLHDLSNVQGVVQALLGIRSEGVLPKLAKLAWKRGRSE